MIKEKYCLASTLATQKCKTCSGSLGTNPTSYLEELSGYICDNCTCIYSHLWLMFNRTMTKWSDELEQLEEIGHVRPNTRPRTTKKLIYAMIRDWCNQENDRRREQLED